MYESWSVPHGQVARSESGFPPRISAINLWDTRLACLQAVHQATVPHICPGSTGDHSFYDEGGWRHRIIKGCIDMTDRAMPCGR